MTNKEKALDLANKGYNKKQIAKELNLTYETVRLYFNETRRKNAQDAVARHRKLVKLKAIDYSGGKCIKCSYNKCVEALAFHHIDPSIKEVRISSGNSRSWDYIKSEIDKTIILCHNCHAEHHAGVFDASTRYEDQMQIRQKYIDRPLKDYIDR